MPACTPEASKPHGSSGASAWVHRFLPAVRPGGSVLDVACGGGRHMRFALELGCTVTGIDRDLSGVRDLAGTPLITLIEADLEAGAPLPVSGRTFDAVIVTNYLWRPILPEIVATVAPSGLLIYETFARGNERYGRPSNPDFLLNPNELLETVRGRLIVIAYEYGFLETPSRVIERIAAMGPQRYEAGEPPKL